MIIHILFEIVDGNKEICKVFSDKKKAEAFIERANSIEDTNIYYKIESWVVDDSVVPC